MKTRVIAVCDREEDYTNNLMQYISEKKGMPFKILAFTDREALLKYLEENYLDILLISVEDMSDQIIGCNIGKIVLLSSGNVFSDYKGFTSIYKYQSGEDIVRTILDYYIEICNSDGIIPLSKSNAEIIGVYSPIGRAGKTSFALTLGQVLVKKYSVLYINLEEFAAFDKLFGKCFSADLSDLMYFFKQNEEVVSVKLKAIVHNVHGMDYVPPLIYSEDLRNVGTEEWIRMIEQISLSGDYEKIILDLSNMVGDVVKVLEICSRIYMPVKDDSISLMKISAYEEYLRKRGMEELLNKTIKIKLPEIESELITDDYMEGLLWGSMGDFAREMTSEECE